MNTTTRTISVETAAKEYGVSKSNMYNQCKKNPNELPFRVITLGKSVRIDSKSFYAWLDGTNIAS